MFKTLATLALLIVAMATTSSATCTDYPYARRQSPIPLCKWLSNKVTHVKQHCAKFHVLCPEACGTCAGLDNLWKYAIANTVDFVANDGTTTDVVEMKTCSFVQKNPASYCGLPGAVEHCQATCA